MAQLVLPGVAARSLRDRLQGEADVVSVRVRAVPAVELLWRQADSVSVRLGSFHADAAQVGRLLGDAGEAGTLDVSAARVRIGLLRLRDATLHARDGALSAHGRVREADLRAAVPFLRTVVPVLSSGGALVLRGTVAALGVAVSADATVSVRDGALVLAPDLPFLAPVTVFSDPHVEVTSVAGAAEPGGLTLSIAGHLR